MPLASRFDKFLEKKFVRLLKIDTNTWSDKFVKIYSIARYEVKFFRKDRVGFSKKGSNDEG